MGHKDPSHSNLITLIEHLDAAEGRLERRFLEKTLEVHIRTLLQEEEDTFLDDLLNHLAEKDPALSGLLLEQIEFAVETHPVTYKKHGHSPNQWIQLIACPFLVWSRFGIPTPKISPSRLKKLQHAAEAHLFAEGVKTQWVDCLFSPEQLPPGFSLTTEFVQASLEAEGKNIIFPSEFLPETGHYLADMRFLIGMVLVQDEAPLFKWHTFETDKSAALMDWKTTITPILETLLPGSPFECLAPNSYFQAWQDADRAIRGYALHAAIQFLNIQCQLEASSIEAIIASCYGEKGTKEEYRIAFGPHEAFEVFHGVTWPLLGEEDEEGEQLRRIQQHLREAGISTIVTLADRFTMEFCDDCGIAFYPNEEGILVHPELPDTAEEISTVLH